MPGLLQKEVAYHPVLYRHLLHCRYYPFRSIPHRNRFYRYTVIVYLASFKQRTVYYIYKCIQCTAMAEQEVIKHTKKIFSIWNSNKGFWHKLQEFIIEVLIIVFAITLSIYLHDRSEKKHERNETKEFLLGLKTDLTLDIAEMNEDKESFLKSSAAFKYIIGIKRNEMLNPDSLKEHYNSIMTITGLIPNSGRFEGFKSSGKMGTIENKALQNDIMDLYQENIPGLISSTNAYTQRKQKLFDYINANVKRITDNTTNLYMVLASDGSFNICNGLVFVQEIVDRYDICLNKMADIIDKIDKEYGK
jgi:hypothetical protein